VEFLSGVRAHAPRGSARFIQPYWLLPYLFLTDVAGTLLGAVLAFSSHVLYPHYATLPALAGMTAIDDQALAGGLMWVLGSLAWLGPLGWIGYRLLLDDAGGAPALRVQHAAIRQNESFGAARERFPATLPAAFDALRLPMVGAILRSRKSRLALRLGMFALAAAIVLDGLTGPQVAAMNLAGVLPWVHWRGVAVLAVLLVGNVVCASCPFTLPRSVLRRWYTPRWEWPRALRNKWLAAALLAAFFLAYEVFDLWASPWWTAWIVLGYFLAVALVDSLFRGAAFCKYVCPIGQFQFAQSLLSPLEIRPRESATCTTCRTHDCLVGNDRSTGCELELFVPRKSSNLDCTLCLACVDACPSANVGLIAISPLQVLSSDRLRGGLARLGGRLDLAVLLMVFVFGAFANALGMVAPVVQSVDWLAEATPLPRRVIEALGFLVVALALPCLLLCVTTTLARRRQLHSESWTKVLAGSCVALLPIGVGMWVAHYGFHFLSGPWSFVPVGERFLTAWGIPWLPAPDWSFNCCAPVAEGVLKFEILALDLGWLTSLYLGYCLTTNQSATKRLALRAWLPWACLITALFVLGIWIVFQPMEMRGMLSTGGAA
jgi:ferredoxin